VGHGLAHLVFLLLMLWMLLNVVAGSLASLNHSCWHRRTQLS
jgi:hypothetical protein